MSTLILPEKVKRHRDEVMISEFASMILVNYLDNTDADGLKQLIDDARKCNEPFRRIWQGLYKSGIASQWLDEFESKKG